MQNLKDISKNLTPLLVANNIGIFGLPRDAKFFFKTTVGWDDDEEVITATDSSSSLWEVCCRPDNPHGIPWLDLESWKTVGLLQEVLFEYAPWGLVFDGEDWYINVSLDPKTECSKCGSPKKVKNSWVHPTIGGAVALALIAVLKMKT